MKSILLRSVIALAGGVLAFGCSPSLRSMSAGRVGCSPGEIEISNEESSYRARTWTATCPGGAVYHCSQNAMGSGRMSRTPVVEDVACTLATSEAADSSPAPASSASSAAPARTVADGEPPRSAGGFDLKMTRALAEQRCTEASKRWEPVDDRSARCSGTAADVGFEAAVHLQFCGSEACSIALTSTPTGKTPREWLVQYARLLRALEQKYGDVHVTSRGQHADQCGDAQLEECLSDGFAQLVTQWRWRGGESLTMVLARKGDHAAPMELRLVYRDRSEQGPRVDAL